ncbi:MAG: hypothetical protein CME63_02885 [Halobacteriovoraceae bacterium]|nr:hypothetical protein [Halobacteriovoraceae bacterium]|tara:strand:- start:14282 stop:14695 length:414 start_codon:yes stop_codon:yes gene_type:complete
MKLIIILLYLLFSNAEEMPTIKIAQYKNNKPFILENINKKIVINFWATWCTSCIKEIDELERLKNNNPNVEFIAINAGDSKKKIKKFLKKHPWTYKILMDVDKSISKSLGVLSLPQTWVLDKKRTIIYKNTKPPSKI